MIFNEGDFECVKNLLRPAESVLRQGRDIIVEDFSKREHLWYEVSESYDKYMEGYCAEFLEDLDKAFRGKFEAALAILAWSFNKNGEDFYPAARRFSKEELDFVEEILKFNVFEIMTKDDILNKLYRRNPEVVKLLKTYYLGMDKWLEDQLNNPNIKLYLRYNFKKTWERYKEKLNEAISEANKYGWFRTLLEEWERDKRESVEEQLKKRELELQAREREIEEKEKELRKKIAELTNLQLAAEKGSRQIRVGEARMAEMNFIERLRSKLKLVEINGRTFEAKSKTEFKLLLEGGISLTALAIEMKEKKILGGHKFRINAIFFVRPRLESLGLDTDPVELEEVERILSNFRNSEDRLAIVIASPLGFEDRVRRFIDSEDFYRNFYSERISLLLLDTETNELIFNPNDAFARSISDYVQLEIEPEVYEKVKRCVLSKLKGDYLTLSEALSCGDEKYVKKAFYEVAKEVGGNVKYIEGFGLVLIRR